MKSVFKKRNLHEELSLEQIKKIYHYREKELYQLHSKGESGRKVAQKRSDLIDILLKSIFILCFYTFIHLKRRLFYSL